MMSPQTGDQSQLFYLLNLEGRIPSGHFLRRINPVVTTLQRDRPKLVCRLEASAAGLFPTILVLQIRCFVSYRPGEKHVLATSDHEVVDAFTILSRMNCCRGKMAVRAGQIWALLSVHPVLRP